jgi:hypothetical protein
VATYRCLLCGCSTDLLALPTCDPDKSFAVQISHEETMVQGPVAFVQCALLHTSSNGERRIRWAQQGAHKHCLWPLLLVLTPCALFYACNKALLILDLEACAPAQGTLSIM